MSADWRRLSASIGVRVTGECLEVSFDDGRRQVVEVDDSVAGHVRLWSLVAPARDVRQMDEPRLHAWRRNRVTELVGFRLDARGRLIGEVYVPTAGLTVAEWDLYVRSLARACDRTEYLLTGRDDS